jgi:outer membrane protein assembly factor BamB
VDFFVFRRRPTAVISVLAGLVGILAACSLRPGPVATTPPAGFAYDVPLDPRSPWPKFRRDSGQTGRSTMRAAMVGGHKWSFKTGKGIFSSPVIDGDGTVYIGSADRKFYAIDKTGRLKWPAPFLTGEIIDSSALLDDRGLVYFGSGDGHYYAFDARSGTRLWTFAADSPKVTGAFINWFEGNSAIGPDGTLFVPNDNFLTYALDRMTGTKRWDWTTKDQTWSVPAVDVARRALFFGNNFMLSDVPNTFALRMTDGAAIWQARAEGSVVASPLVNAHSNYFVGAFDGYLRAYEGATGRQMWKFGARDHIYSSPAELPDGTIVQPSADGSIYALHPSTGKLIWQFDTLAPIRSSPAVDADGHIYVGSGDGRLLVLNPDGRLRWALKLAKGPRGTLNSSPALGTDAIVVGDSDGYVHSVPYDYCLRAEGTRDADCASADFNLPADGAFVLYTTEFGLPHVRAPSEIDANQPLAFTLYVRKQGHTELALIDPATVKVQAEPAIDVGVDISGDRRFFNVVPKGALPAGPITLTVSGTYLVDPRREGLRFIGGRVGGRFDQRFTFTVRGGDGSAHLPLPVPARPGDPSGVWVYSRLALALPSLMPSYNQIGFDSLEYLLGLVEPSQAGTAIAWMIGAKLAEGENRTVVDPDARMLVPFVVRYDRGLLTLTADDATMELNGFETTATHWQIGARLDAKGSAVGSPVFVQSVDCARIGFYGVFLERLGICTTTPPIMPLRIFGGAELAIHDGGVQKAPSGLGTVTFAVESGKIIARVTGSTLRRAAHKFGVLAIDAGTGRPLALNYSYKTVSTEGPTGVIQSVSVDVPAAIAARPARVYLMVDTYPAALGSVTLP